MSIRSKKNVYIKEVNNTLKRTFISPEYRKLHDGDCYRRKTQKRESIARMVAVKQKLP